MVVVKVVDEVDRGVNQDEANTDDEVVSTATHAAIVYTSGPNAKILAKVTSSLQPSLTCKEEAQEVACEEIGQEIRLVV